MAKIKIKDVKQFVRDNILEIERSRTGQIKVDVSKVFRASPKGENLVIGAWYNYLGGGMCGRVVGASMFNHTYLSEKDQTLFQELKEAAKQVLYSYDEVELDENGYETNQRLPVSAY